MPTKAASSRRSKLQLVKNGRSVLVQRGRKQFCLKIVIHKAVEGGYWVEVPGFPGCVSEGDTLDEARANIREAFEGVFMVMQDTPTEEPGRIEELAL